MFKKLLVSAVAVLSMVAGGVSAEASEKAFTNEECSKYVAKIIKLLKYEYTLFGAGIGRDSNKAAIDKPGEIVNGNNGSVLFEVKQADSSCKSVEVKLGFDGHGNNNSYNATFVMTDLNMVDGQLWGEGYTVDRFEINRHGGVEHGPWWKSKNKFVCQGYSCEMGEIDDLIKAGKIDESDPWPQSVKAKLARKKAEKETEKIKAAEQAKAAKEAARKFVKLGPCQVGETVTHREAWNSTTSSGNFLADALFNASIKEEFIIEFEGVVKGMLGKKVEVYLQDYSVKQTKGGGFLQPVTNVGDALTQYADKRIGKSHFFDKSRCGN